MKLKQGFILRNIADEYMGVATGPAAKVFNGLVRNNETANFIYERLLHETTVEEIVAAMLEEYDAPKERIEADVLDVIDKIRGAGLLDE